MRRDPKHQGADAEFEEHIRTRTMRRRNRPAASGWDRGNGRLTLCCGSLWHWRAAAPEPEQIERYGVERLHAHGRVAVMRGDEHPEPALQPQHFERLRLWVDEPHVRHAFSGIDTQLRNAIERLRR